MIPKHVFDQYKKVVDGFIQDLGIDFKLTFQSIEECTCQTNIYGGPNVMNERCSYCETGKIIEKSSIVRLRFYPDKKYWIRTSEVPSVDATAQIIGFLSDLPDIKKSKYMTKKSEQLSQKFILAGEPQSHGFQHDRYFIAYLQQIV